MRDRTNSTPLVRACHQAVAAAAALRDPRPFVGLTRKSSDKCTLKLYLYHHFIHRLLAEKLPCIATVYVQSNTRAQPFTLLCLACCIVHSILSYLFGRQLVRHDYFVLGFISSLILPSLLCSALPLSLPAPTPATSSTGPFVSCA